MGPSTGASTASHLSDCQAPKYAHLEPVQVHSEVTTAANVAIARLEVAESDARSATGAAVTIWAGAYTTVRARSELGRLRECWDS